MLLPFILSAGAFLLSANIAGVGAQDNSTISDKQQCLNNCNTDAAAGTTCLTDLTCLCTSQIYNTTLTNCATTKCNITAVALNQVLSSACFSGTGSASVSASGPAAVGPSSGSAGPSPTTSGLAAVAPGPPSDVPGLSKSTKTGSAIALNGRVGLAVVCAASLTVASLFI